MAEASKAMQYPSILSLDKWLSAVVEPLGSIFIFVYRGFHSIVFPKFRWNLLIEQLDFIGNGPLFIITLTALFTGGVTALQTYYGLAKVGGYSLVGPVVALGLARELAPVFAGLMVTGRAGAAMAAQIATMRVREQIDALEVMAVDPVNYLVGPRLLATLISMPLLAGAFMLVGNLGSWIVGVHLLGIDSGIYFSKLPELFFLEDIWQGLIKATVFGATLSIVGTYYGYNAEGGALGVGSATNKAVVSASVLILVLDYFMTPLLRAFL